MNLDILNEIEQEYGEGIKEIYKYYWFNPSLALLRSIEALLVRKEIYKILSKQSLQSLEIGIGNSVFSQALNHIFDEGIDQSKKQIERSRIYGKHKKYNEVRIDDGRDYFDTNKERFDLIVVNSVLEHVSEILSAIKNIFSLTSKNGVVIITLPLKQNLLTGYCPHDLKDIHISFNNEYLDHKNLFSRSKWEELFKQVGFEIEISYCYLFENTSSYIQASSFFKTEVNNRMINICQSDLINIYRETYSLYQYRLHRPFFKEELSLGHDVTKIGDGLLLVINRNSS